MKFEFHKPTTVKVAHLNIRAELHGDETKTAIDLKLTRVAGNDCLNDFAPGLREALYCRSANTEAQADVPGVDKLLPNLRFPMIDGLAIDSSIEGAAVTISYGIGDAIELGGCKVNKFRCELAEGGSVTTSFRVQTSSIPDGALDRLASLLDYEAQITLIPPQITLIPPQVEDDPADDKVTPIKAKKSKGEASKDALDKAGNPFGDEKTLFWERSATDTFIGLHSD